MKTRIEKVFLNGERQPTYFLDIQEVTMQWKNLMSSKDINLVKQCEQAYKYGWRQSNKSTGS